MSEYILKVDATNTGVDGSTAYQAYVTSKAVVPSGSIQVLCHTQESNLCARARSATVQMMLIKNFGEQSATDTVSTAAVAFETRVIRKFDSAQLADITHLQLQLGDASAINQLWSLDMLYMEYYKDGER